MENDAPKEIPSRLLRSMVKIGRLTYSKRVRKRTDEVRSSDSGYKIDYQLYNKSIYMQINLVKIQLNAQSYCRRKGPVVGTVSIFGTLAPNVVG